MIAARPRAVFCSSFAGLLAFLLWSGAVDAQGAPLVVEVHGGMASPIGAFRSGSATGEGARSGTSFAIDFALTGSGRRTTYVGFSQHRFACEEAGCARGGEFVATGVDLGWRVSLRSAGSVIPWIRAGAMTTRVETRDLPAPNSGVSKLGFGGEIGVGVYVGSSSLIAFNPGLRVVAVNTDLPGGSRLAMRYVVADLALSLAF